MLPFNVFFQYVGNLNFLLLYFEYFVLQSEHSSCLIRYLTFMLSNKNVKTNFSDVQIDK